ncbi:hypothetical protein [Alicyclobacillus acidoterrestris]|uniref:Uncharacterized protein n=1 Tax=Alicyclobacillus acidoterrestris (strain ATCC 49025 / DSM 3922 / CIP 106132 / NCIMB 13137 / GD3B) TaxID=1356854 RepID=T0C532_ALIAG|nr:hypothetical protein [Alicyclobacillus acidoterrestris]EPZ47650.1 hypothetical protein N007_05175 [Alicyclobacillus acidoterrestris ATCC 49025]UNO48031.1 hypothetical protein K1I37_15260 [Alicyclobacillus acidoterrestris]
MSSRQYDAEVYRTYQLILFDESSEKEYASCIDPIPHELAESEARKHGYAQYEIVETVSTVRRHVVE